MAEALPDDSSIKAQGQAAYPLFFFFNDSQLIKKNKTKYFSTCSSIKRLSVVSASRCEENNL